MWIFFEKTIFLVGLIVSVLLLVKNCNNKIEKKNDINIFILLIILFIMLLIKSFKLLV
jgi:hypothetical protein